MQLLSGIALATGIEVGKVGEDSKEGLELVRRQELQANCFSGLFLASAAGRGSVSGGLANSAVQSFRNTVADDTHGKIANQVRWGTDGFKQKTTSACNTWTAPAAQVA